MADGYGGQKVWKGFSAVGKRKNGLFNKLLEFKPNEKLSSPFFPLSNESFYLSDVYRKELSEMSGIESVLAIAGGGNQVLSQIADLQVSNKIKEVYIVDQDEAQLKNFYSHLSALENALVCGRDYYLHNRVKMEVQSIKPNTTFRLNLSEICKFLNGFQKNGKSGKYYVYLSNIDDWLDPLNWQNVLGTISKSDVFADGTKIIFNCFNRPFPSMLEKRNNELKNYIPMNFGSGYR
ncbi:MAG: hypothetical protein M1348_03520 [Candidatus Parvarchaeota archaeon]|nr:hypothetical protein [Candidatus Parvarchaeota archaeon]